MKWRLAGVAGGLLAWLLISGTGVVSSLILPSPRSLVILAMREGFIISELQEAMVTALRLLVGCVIGFTVAIPLGLFVGSNRRAELAMMPWIDLSRSVPVASLFPLFLLLFGFGEAAKYAAAAWSSGLIVLLNTIFGVQAVAESRLRMMRSFGATRRQMFARVVMPSALPQILSGVRVAVSIGLIVVVMTEMFFGADSGLGHQIYGASLRYEIPEMYFGIVTAGLLGFAVSWGVEAVERRLIHWRGQA